MMTNLNFDKLLKQIIAHEGIIPWAYEDTKGFLTIGCGRLIDKRKGGRLSYDEINYLLSNDVKSAIQDLQTFVWYKNQDEVRQGVLIELVFNMGLPHLLGFAKMIAALTIKDYITAAHELLTSQWATKDVGAERVKDIQHRLLTGHYQ